MDHKSYWAGRDKGSYQAYGDAPCSNCSPVHVKWISTNKVIIVKVKK
jgi:hypothetical protein